MRSSGRRACIIIGLSTGEYNALLVYQQDNVLLLVYQQDNVLLLVYQQDNVLLLDIEICMACIHVAVIVLDGNSFLDVILLLVSEPCLSVLHLTMPGSIQVRLCHVFIAECCVAQ